MKKGFLFFTISLLNLNAFAGSLVCQFKMETDASVTISNDIETGFMAEVDDNLTDEGDGEILTEKKSLHLSFEKEVLSKIKLMTKSPLTLDLSNMTAQRGSKTVDLECTSSEKPAEELAAILGSDTQGFTFTKPNDKDFLTTAFVKNQSVFENEANDRVPASK